MPLFYVKIYRTLQRQNLIIYKSIKSHSILDRIQNVIYKFNCIKNINRKCGGGAKHVVLENSVLTGYCKTKGIIHKDYSS